MDDEQTSTVNSEPASSAGSFDDSPSGDNATLDAGLDNQPAATSENAGEDTGDGGQDAPEPGTDADTREKFIPRDRFDEVNSQLAELKKYAPVIEELKKSGYADGQAVLDAQQARQEEAARNNWLKTEAQRIATALQPLIDSEELTMEEAEAKFDVELERAELSRDRQLLTQQTQKIELAALKKTFPNMNERTALALHKAEGIALTEAARLSHEEGLRVRDQNVTEYATQKGKVPAAPEKPAGAPLTPKAVNQMTDAEFDAYFNTEVRRAKGA